MPSWLCNSMWPQHTLQMFADHYGPRLTIPWNTINQGLLQPQGELYPSQPIFNHRSWHHLLKFRMTFLETISSQFLVQGNFKHTVYTRALVLTGLKLATTHSASEYCIDWANLTVRGWVIQGLHNELILIHTLFIVVSQSERRNLKYVECDSNVWTHTRVLC